VIRKSKSVRSSNFGDSNKAAVGVTGEDMPSAGGVAFSAQVAGGCPLRRAQRRSELRAPSLR
jgi:hypothetical protein